MHPLQLPLEQSQTTENTNNTIVGILIFVQVAMPVLLAAAACKFSCLLQLFHVIETITSIGSILYQLQVVKYEKAASYSVMAWMLTTLINYIFYSCRFAQSLIVSVLSLLALQAFCFRAGSQFDLTRALLLLIWLLVSILTLECMKRRLLVSLLKFFS